MADAFAAPTLAATLTPQPITPSSFGVLVVTIETATPIAAGNLEIVAPPGFTAEPKSISLGAVAAGRVARQVNIQAPRAYAPSGQMSLTAILSDKSSGDLASEVVHFEYAGSVGLAAYFGLGFLGILLGYVVRMVVDVINSLPKPSVSAAEVAAAAGPTRLVSFVKNHYYLTDCFVTLALGFVVLVSLVKDGHAPESGSSWYAALALGFALGLLTNSDLITRLRTK